MSDGHANTGSVYHASVVRGCVPASISSSLFYHFWFLKHRHSAATPHHHSRCMGQLLYRWKLHAGRANTTKFIYIYIYIFFLYVFGILFNCIIQNISYCLHWQYFSIYQQQMHQIIHLSLVGCFTPAWGKSMQKNRNLSGVKHNQILNLRLKVQHNLVVIITVLNWSLKVSTD